MSAFCADESRDARQLSLSLAASPVLKESRCETDVGGSDVASQSNKFYFLCRIFAPTNPLNFVEDALLYAPILSVQR